MKVALLQSSAGVPGDEPLQYLTSYLLNDRVALDAGCLGLWGTPAEQARVQHVLISHTHLDHTASLPVFLENVYGLGGGVTVHGSDAVLDCLRRDFFNDRVWVDLGRLPQEPPYVKWARLEPGKPVELEGLRVTPVPVHHAVPTLGFLVEDAAGAVAFSSDTGPTDELWARAGAMANLRAVFLEASFPDALGWLAAASGHLTPERFAAELRKLPRPVPAVAVHIKPRYREQVVKELQALGLPELQIARFGVPYEL